MYQKLSATLCCLVLSCALYAQTGWLPPVSFPSNTNVCDGSPWKLVFYDDFNGNVLSDKWRTAVTYDEDRVWRNGNWVIKGEQENHANARYNPTDGPCLYLQDNIVVSNGTCKLLMKYAPGSSWTVRDSQNVNYPLVTQHADLTSAIIKLPHEDVNRTPKGYSSGRFEARIKHPVFVGSWTAFWMWFGRGRVNELDITESRGGESAFNRHTVDYAMHGWYEDWWQYNYTNLPGEAGISRKYPNQEWYKWIFGGYFQMQNWHTYTYEWDTASVAAFVDGSFVDKIWKYYQDRTMQIWEYKNGQWRSRSFTYRVGSECNPDPGIWNITYGYPWNSNDANCDVRFECKFKPGAQEDYHLPSGSSSVLLGQMEIDYLKIWQKHPENDNHTDICAYSGPIPSLTSNRVQICSNGTTFTVNPAIPGGWWDFSGTLSVMGSSNNSITLYNNTGNSYGNGYVRYHYAQSVPGCPTRYIERMAFCTENPHHNPHGGNLMVVNTKANNGLHMFQLFEANEYPILEDGTITKPTFEWDIDLIDPLKRTDSTHYKAYGQFVSIPYSLTNETEYNLIWKLKVTDVDGSVAYKDGIRTESSSLSQQADPTVYYLDANIADPDSYEDIVQNRVAQTMVSEKESNDNVFLQNMIEKIKVEELEPYLIYDSSIPMKGNAQFPLSSSESKLYPNPANDRLSINLSTSFNKNEAINVEIYDLVGRLVKKLSINNRINQSLDIDDLKEGYYIITLKQNNQTEHHKFTKSKKN